jgi:hypothetical protein
VSCQGAGLSQGAADKSCRHSWSESSATFAERKATFAERKATFAERKATVAER